MASVAPTFATSSAATTISFTTPDTGASSSMVSFGVTMVTSISPLVTLSPGAFGHTGFTGTSLWCDPELDACVVLLSNRVHPTRVNNKITAVRRDVHDLVRAAMR